MYFRDTRTIVLYRKEEAGDSDNRKKLSYDDVSLLLQSCKGLECYRDEAGPTANVIHGPHLSLQPPSVSQLFPHCEYWQKALIVREHALLFLLCSFLLCYVSSYRCLFGLPAKICPVQRSVPTSQVF